MKLIPSCVISLLVAGCTTLNPITDDPVRHLLESAVPRRTPTELMPTVAVARPSLPPYLERTELVTRSGDGRLEIHEKHLWSEPLDAAITRVVADNLRRLTGSTNIQPSSNFITRDYAALLEIRIERFDPGPQGTLLLECAWKLQPTEGGDASPRSFRTKVPIDLSGEAMSARVVAMNNALARLSRTIALEMQTKGG